MIDIINTKFSMDRNNRFSRNTHRQKEVKIEVVINEIHLTVGLIKN